MGNDTKKEIRIKNEMGLFEKDKEILIKGYIPVGVVRSDGNQAKWTFVR